MFKKSFSFEKSASLKVKRNLIMAKCKTTSDVFQAEWSKPGLQLVNLPGVYSVWINGVQIALVQVDHENYIIPKKSII